MRPKANGGLAYWLRPTPLSPLNREVPMPDINDMMAWENGEMDEGREDKLFQQLVDSGLAWTLQGMYGRRASQLLREGRIHR